MKFYKITKSRMEDVTYEEVILKRLKNNLNNFTCSLNSKVRSEYSIWKILIVERTRINLRKCFSYGPICLLEKYHSEKMFSRARDWFLIHSKVPLFMTADAFHFRWGLLSYKRIQLHRQSYSRQMHRRVVCIIAGARGNRAERNTDSSQPSWLRNEWRRIWDKPERWTWAKRYVGIQRGTRCPNFFFLSLRFNFRAQQLEVSLAERGFNVKFSKRNEGLFIVAWVAHNLWNNATK